MFDEQSGCTLAEPEKDLDRIAKWRTERTELAARNEGPLPLAGEITALFHMIPSKSLLRKAVDKSWILSPQEKQNIYVPHRTTHFHYNADGYVCSAQVGDGSEAYGYTQIFLSGMAEYVNSNCYGPTPVGDMILAQEIEKEIVRCFDDGISRLRRQGGQR